MKAIGLSGVNILCVVFVTCPSSSWKGPCVYHSNIRHKKKAVGHWCCGEGEDHAGTKTIPEVQDLVSKIILVLGNAPGHMQDLGFAHPNIQVE